MDDIPLGDIAGDIDVLQDEDALGTLDEPVSTTLVSATSCFGIF